MTDNKNVKTPKTNKVNVQKQNFNQKFNNQNVKKPTMVRRTGRGR